MNRLAPLLALALLGCPAAKKEEVRPAAPLPAPVVIAEAAIDAGPPEPAPEACGPRPDASHCVVFTPRGAPSKLVATLAAQKIDASVEGGLVLAYLSDQAIEQLLGAPPVYRSVARSSGPGFTCTAQLEAPKLPPKLGAKAAVIGHQLCE